MELDRAANRRDECGLVGGVEGAAERFGLEAPDGGAGVLVSRVARDDVPVDVVGDVAQALVVDAGAAGNGADGGGDGGDFAEDLLLLADGQVGQMFGMGAELEHAPAALALLVMEDDAAVGQGGDVPRMGAGVGGLDLLADGAGGHEGRGEGSRETRGKGRRRKAEEWLTQRTRGPEEGRRREGGERWKRKREREGGKAGRKARKGREGGL